MKNISMLLRWSALLVSLVIMSACVSLPKPDTTNPIRTVVILPFSNFSNSVDAPTQLRELFAQKFTYKHYRVLPIADIDLILQDEFGITLGEHLADLDLSEIKEKIHADAYVYGHITHYETTIAGILNTSRVKADMKMIQSSNDRVFWISTLGIKSESKSGGVFGDIASLGSAMVDASDESSTWITIESSTGGDGSIMGNLMSGLIESAVASVTETVLTEESVALVEQSTNTLRNGPGI